MINDGVITDLELFQRIADGNEAAFEQIFNNYVLAVSRIILNIVKSETVAQDLVQDVFLQLWLTRYKLSDVQDPGLWIYRMAYNRSYKQIRSKQVQERAAATLHLGQEYDSWNTQDQLDLQETTRLINQAVRQLPNQSRTIYELNRVQGMKPAAIAEECGISVQSVRNSLTRSAKMIRDYLAQQGIVIPLFLLLLPFPPGS